MNNCVLSHWKPTLDGHFMHKPQSQRLRQRAIKVVQPDWFYSEKPAKNRKLKRVRPSDVKKKITISIHDFAILKGYSSENHLCCNGLISIFADFSGPILKSY